MNIEMKNTIYDTHHPATRRFIHHQQNRTPQLYKRIIVRDAQSSTLRNICQPSCYDHHAACYFDSLLATAYYSTCDTGLLVCVVSYRIRSCQWQIDFFVSIA